MVPKVFIKLVDEYKCQIPIIDILKLFGVAKSTYYRWKSKDFSANEQLCDNEKEVIQLCKDNKYRYGYRKITAIIRKNRIINKNTVQRIMQKHKCNCRVKVKKYRKNKLTPITTDNIIDRNVSATRPYEKLVTDITYLPFGPKMLYLSSIMDLYNGEIVAYTISDKQDLKCVKDTLNQLPKLISLCILHSDQGSVYTSPEYQKLVKSKSITMSMSRKGTPADNAPIESFHSSLKSETFYIQAELNSSTSIVSQTVIDYIYYFNNIRIQEKLGYISPIDYRVLNFPN